MKERPTIREGYVGSTTWRDIFVDEERSAATQANPRQYDVIAYDEHADVLVAGRRKSVLGDVLTGLVTILVIGPIAFAFSDELRAGRRWLTATIAAAWRLVT